MFGVLSVSACVEVADNEDFVGSIPSHALIRSFASSNSLLKESLVPFEILRDCSGLRRLGKVHAPLRVCVLYILPFRALKSLHGRGAW